MFDSFYIRQVACIVTSTTTNYDKLFIITINLINTNILDYIYIYIYIYIYKIFIYDFLFIFLFFILFVLNFISLKI